MSRLTIAVAVGACLLPATSQAAPHPIVAGFERFHAAKPDANGGRLLLSELGCVACHQPKAEQPQPKPAPILDGVGTRLRVSFLRRYLADPQAVKPGSTMPAMLHGLPDKERADQIESLVHFLASTGPLKHEAFDARFVGRGRDLYSKVGCVACHGSRDAAGLPDKVTAASVPLGDLKAKYTVHSLAAFLANPLHVRPGGRMPKLLDAKETKDVACYLLQGLKVPSVAGKGTTRFAYYEGDWMKLPDFGKLKPLITSTTQGFNLSVAKRMHHYGIRFRAFFGRAPRASITSLSPATTAPGCGSVTRKWSTTMAFMVPRPSRARSR